MKRMMMLLAAALLPLLAAQAATFTEDTHIPDGDATYEGQPVTVSGCTLTVDGAHVFTNLYLVNSATLTHTAGSAGMTLTVSGMVSVATGSKIDVSGKGLLPLPETTGRSGGSYGGRGGNYMGDSAMTYGDACWPTNLGSGGISERAAHTRGGGCIHVQADLFTLDGMLCANGQSEGGDYTAGGSGGGILLDVGTLSGSGTIQANGGNPFSIGSQGGGAGGGGRIALYYGDDSAFTPQAIEAAGGNHNGVGGAGTVYRERNGMPGLLRLDNRGYSTSEQIPTVIAFHSNRFDCVETLRGARVELTVTHAAADASISKRTCSHWTERYAPTAKAVGATTRQAAAAAASCSMSARCPAAARYRPTAAILSVPAARAAARAAAGASRCIATTTARSHRRLSKRPAIPAIGPAAPARFISNAEKR